MVGRLVAIAALLALASMPAALAFNPGGSKGPEKKPATKADIPLIKCQVCEGFIKQAMSMVKTLRAEEKPGKKMTEEQIIDNLEKMCNPDDNAGEWITKIDLQEDGDELKVVDMGQVGECGVECRTVARACEQIQENMDLSDLSELLYKNSGRSALTQLACRDQTGVCNKKTPPMPKGRVPGPEFVAMDADTLQREKMMRGMRAAGLKGTMYDRDSIADMAANMGKGKGMGDDDDDDDDEPRGDPMFPADETGMPKYESVSMAGGEL